MRTAFPGTLPLDGFGVGVTGGGGHLGRALCVGLARQGAFVVALGRNEASLRATADAARAAGCAGDVVAVDETDARVRELRENVRRLGADNVRVVQADGRALPPELAGFLVSLLILSPESLTAIRAALANQLQRSVNILLGSVLASIGLTIPAVLAVGFLTGHEIVLGLGATDTNLLLLTLVLSTLTFAAQRTNVVLGAVHLLVFFAYLLFIFER